MQVISFNKRSIVGDAVVMQSNWRQADREWHSGSHLEVQSQRQYLTTLARLDRLLTIQSI